MSLAFLFALSLSSVRPATVDGGPLAIKSATSVLARSAGRLQQLQELEAAPRPVARRIVAPPRQLKLPSWAGSEDARSTETGDDEARSSELRAIRALSFVLAARLTRFEQSMDRPRQTGAPQRPWLTGLVHQSVRLMERNNKLINELLQDLEASAAPRAPAPPPLQRSFAPQKAEALTPETGGQLLNALHGLLRLSSTVAPAPQPLMGVVGRWQPRSNGWQSRDSVWLHEGR